MNLDTFVVVMDRRVSRERYAELLGPYNDAMLAADCTTIPRAAMFAAQIGHESGGMRYTEEIADGSAYEGRRDLGNTQPGDGRRYKGRGPIQVTGRANYSTLSKWAHARGVVDSPTKFVDEPHLLAEPRFGFLGAVWYWTSARPMNTYADRRDLEAATRAVNGGTNGLADRRKFYDRALAVGPAILPERSDMSIADDELSKKFPSRSRYRTNDEPIDTLAGYVLNVDARIHEEFVEREAAKGEQWARDLVKREADKGDTGAKAAMSRWAK